MKRIKPTVEMQIGKKGFTEGNMTWLENAFKDRENIKIHVLKSARDKEKVEEIAKKIIEKLGVKYNYRIIGFTISLRKYRKAQR